MDSKCVNYQFECQYCNPKVEKYVSATKQAMKEHYLIVHNERASCTNINELLDVTLGQIFEKFPLKERLKLEQVCKKWYNASKNFGWENFRIFNNDKFAHWKVTKMTSFFDRCGRYLRHLTLGDCSAQEALTLLKTAPNVLHLSLSFVNLNDECLKELAQILPGLKSMSLINTFQCYEDVNDYNLGLLECFKVMTHLEYLRIDGDGSLFDQYPFVQFPPNLKYLHLDNIGLADETLSWVAEGCKDFKGLRLTDPPLNEDAALAISRMKSFVQRPSVQISAQSQHCAVLSRCSLAARRERQCCDWLDGGPSGRTDEGLRFFSLLHAILCVLTLKTASRVLKAGIGNPPVIACITKYCKKLEHLGVRDTREFSPDIQSDLLCLASLPSLCSLAILADYSKEQTTELIERLIDIGNLQYVKMDTSKEPLEPEVLLKMLRQCKRIKTISLNIGEIDFEFYSRICQIVDEVDEKDWEQSQFVGEEKVEFPEDGHPIVEMEYYGGTTTTGNIRPYKWFRLTDKVSRQAAFEKWEYGMLSAGKP
ncbi:F-box protein SKIP2-like isoform X2 [Ditylenchus destructor]|nr:F-box protein SKIP2-like isoform X2 [Ditylenchus destructor]